MTMERGEFGFQSVIRPVTRTVLVRLSRMSILVRVRPAGIGICMAVFGSFVPG